MCLNFTSSKKKLSIVLNLYYILLDNEKFMKEKNNLEKSDSSSSKQNYENKAEENQV